MSKRDKLDVQIEHGFNNKSLTEKASQRIVYLKKPTPKNPDNNFESNPGVKVKVNEGYNSCLKMDRSIIQYDRSKTAAENLKDRVQHLPRIENRKNKELLTFFNFAKQS